MTRFVPRYAGGVGDWFVYDTVCKDLLNWAESEADAKARCDALNAKPPRKEITHAQ